MLVGSDERVSVRCGGEHLQEFGVWPLAGGRCVLRMISGSIARRGWMVAR